MKILTIGFDKDLFKKGSIPQMRHVSYGALVEEMHIIFFASKKLGFEKQKINENVWVYPTNSSSKIGFFVDAYNLGKKILRGKREKWLISAQDPFEAGLVGYLLKKRCRVPLQIQEHGDFFSAPYWRKESFLNLIKYYLGSFLITKADGVRVVSDCIKKTLINKGVSEEKIIKVHVRTDLDYWFTQKPKVNLHDMYPKSDSIVLTAARLVKQKNLTLLIHAFKKVIAKHPRSLLFIVGQGPLEENLKKLTDDLQIKGQVIFLPWTDDVLSYFKTADIYALSSNYEGWGRVVIEAAAAKLPIVMTNVGCAGEVIENKKSGIVVPIDDCEAFSKALIDTIENRNFANTFSQNAFEKIKSLPTEKEILSLYKKGWEKCLS